MRAVAVVFRDMPKKSTSKIWTFDLRKVAGSAAAMDVSTSCDCYNKSSTTGND